jgi:hypothetical protein
MADPEINNLGRTKKQLKNHIAYLRQKSTESRAGIIIFLF